jgi:hypothetical protein
MYFERAKMGIKLTSTEALRKFYEKNKYALLKKDETLDNIEKLAQFWTYVESFDDTYFSDRVLKKLSVLKYAPNGMWAYIVSVYFMHNKDSNNTLEDQKFYDFLDRIIAFIWVYAVMRPGVNALRSPIYPAMIDIVNNKEVAFTDYKFDKVAVRNAFETYQFTNGRPITKSMLAWWAYSFDGQGLIPVGTALEIEHIYPKKRQENERGLSDKDNLESIGNKALLEKSINIRAADYRMVDKKKYYTGYTNDNGDIKEGTKIVELVSIANNHDDYTEQDIVARKNQILDRFIEYLDNTSLLQFVQ